MFISWVHDEVFVVANLLRGPNVQARCGVLTVTTLAMWVLIMYNKTNLVRATQILGGKLKKHLGRGGRVLRFEIYNLCAYLLTIKFKFSARNHERIRIYHYMTISILIMRACWITLVKRQVGSDFSGFKAKRYDASL